LPEKIVNFLERCERGELAFRKYSKTPIKSVPCEISEVSLLETVKDDKGIIDSMLDCRNMAF